MSNYLTSKVTLTLLTGVLLTGVLGTAGWHATKYFLQTKKEVTSTQTNTQNNKDVEMLSLDEVDVVNNTNDASESVETSRDFKKLFSNL